MKQLHSGIDAGQSSFKEKKAYELIHLCDTGKNLPAAAAPAPAPAPAAMAASEPVSSPQQPEEHVRVRT